MTKNVLSLGKLTQKGIVISFDDNTMTLTNKNGKTMTISKKSTDVLFYIWLDRTIIDEENNNVETEEKKEEENKMDVNEAHRKMGHMSEAMTSNSIIKRPN